MRMTEAELCLCNTVLFLLLMIFLLEQQVLKCILIDALIEMKCSSMNKTFTKGRLGLPLPRPVLGLAVETTLLDL